MKPLDNPVGLRGLHCHAIVDFLELQEQLVEMPIRSSAQLAAIVGEHGLDPSRHGMTSSGAPQ